MQDDPPSALHLGWTSVSLIVFARLCVRACVRRQMQQWEPAHLEANPTALATIGPRKKTKVSDFRSTRLLPKYQTAATDLCCFDAT